MSQLSRVGGQGEAAPYRLEARLRRQGKPSFEGLDTHEEIAPGLWLAQERGTEALGWVLVTPAEYLAETLRVPERRLPLSAFQAMCLIGMKVLRR